MGASSAAPDFLGFGARLASAEDCLTADTGLIVVEDRCLIHGFLFLPDSPVGQALFYNFLIRKKPLKLLCGRVDSG